MGNLVPQLIRRVILYRTFEPLECMSPPYHHEPAGLHVVRHALGVESELEGRARREGRGRVNERGEIRNSLGGEGKRKERALEKAGVARLAEVGVDHSVPAVRVLARRPTPSRQGVAIQLPVVAVLSVPIVHHPIPTRLGGGRDEGASVGREGR